MRIIDRNCRILCRTLLCDEQIKHMQIVTLTDGNVTVTPFTVETAATTFEPEPVAVVSRHADTECLGSIVTAAMCRNNLIAAINLQLTEMHLYANRDAMLCVVS